ncbi:MAG: CinA family nicotinamide mononucleotide deamidase-related protein [Haliscomenobacter sp.]|nr:CinA family nicotinamide mononucleotide deamidase-related protein [Haliscomenobacter sp.]
MQVSILTIGDEILIGQVIDTNSAWMGQQLNRIGMQVGRVISVGDTLDAIHRGLEMALEGAGAVLITGGLGPTKDDITKKALADFFGVELVFHEPTFQRIGLILEKFNRAVTEAHRLQAFLPSNAEVLPNKMGTAPGMWMEWGTQTLISMPGVPFEMKYLMEYEVLPKLQAKYPGTPIGHRTLLTVGEGESTIAARLSTWEDELPDGLKLAYLPSLGQVRLRLTGIGPNAEALNALLDQKVRELASFVTDCLYGTESDQLETAIGRMLKARNLHLATAESCTGGYISHLITSISGSSAYFTGGVIAYSNQIKTEQLGVQEKTLEQFGAVSEQTVREMVSGILARFPAHIALAISGIAGPDGGTPQKPVGTIWIAVGDKHRIQAEQLHAGKDRIKNIQFSSVMALNKLRKFILEYYPLPGSELEVG